MKIFRFRLQSLLDYRLHLESKARTALAVEIGKQEEFRRQLQELDREFSSIGPLQKTLTDGRASGEDYMRFSRWTSELRRRIRAQMEAMGSQQEKIKQARQELLLKKRDRKALDLLCEKHYKAWKKENNRKLVHFLDDLGQSAYIRKAERNVA